MHYPHSLLCTSCVHLFVAVRPELRQRGYDKIRLKNINIRSIFSTRYAEICDNNFSFLASTPELATSTFS